MVIRALCNYEYSLGHRIGLMWCGVVGSLCSIVGRMLRPAAGWVKYPHFGFEKLYLKKILFFVFFLCVL